ncbi:CLUMA_CG001939, isoform A [Clunio marinus]|uniref:CLUMA_CG001939, isoform A n=1 Tax=Clunio marinus TaxID=568069 RepID=A0A1J1HKU3_9DIPT|nr:CLUMA_CG001939, isoform A [Clunio marinus]
MQALSNIVLKSYQISALRVASSNIHSTASCLKADDRREILASMPKKDEGTEGEKTIAIDQLIQKDRVSMFPDETTPTTLFNGTPFKDLPIVAIKTTKNNTIIQLTDAQGVAQLFNSCGMEGFKNTRKGTNIAAQSTAISLSAKILERGIKTVRVTVRGLGPGRMSAIKGLQMGGMNIISITDTTRVSWNPPRPRKQRKL